MIGMTVSLTVADGRAGGGGQAAGRLAAPVTALAGGKARADATVLGFHPGRRRERPRVQSQALRAGLGIQASPGIEPGPGLAGAAG